MAQGEQLAWQVLTDHFQAGDLNEIASSRRRFASHLLPDLQAAITAHLAAIDAVLSGVHQPHEFQALTISDLLIRTGNFVASITPLQYQDRDIGEDEPFSALNNGLWLFRIKDAPIVVLLSQYDDHFGRTKIAQVEIAYLPSEDASRFARQFLRDVQSAGETSRMYRGKVLSFESSSAYSGMRSDMQVHRMPKVERADVILSDDTMARLDQHVFEFDRHRKS